MSYLLVSNEDPVDLDGYLDGSGALQIKHDSDNLVDYDQEIWCEHDTATSITIRIYDFVDSSTTWQMSAEHDSTSWTRESDHCWFEFTSEPASPIAVEVTATAGEVKKVRTIYTKPQPQPQGNFVQPPPPQPNA